MKNELIKVLVLDDEDSIKDVICAFLEDSGYVADSANNGNEGLELMEKNHYDVAVVDLRMKDMNGEQFILNAYAIWPETCFFIHTGSPEYELSDDLMKLGITRDHILIKPIFDLNILPGKMDELLNRR